MSRGLGDVYKRQVLADDLHSKDKNSQDTLNTLKEYIRRISKEMSYLDSRDEEENEK